jgi:hypothetical protein
MFAFPDPQANHAVFHRLRTEDVCSSLHSFTQERLAKRGGKYVLGLLDMPRVKTMIREWGMSCIVAEVAASAAAAVADVVPADVMENVD